MSRFDLSERSQHESESDQEQFENRIRREPHIVGGYQRQPDAGFHTNRNGDQCASDCPPASQGKQREPGWDTGIDFGQHQSGADLRRFVVLRY